MDDVIYQEVQCELYEIFENHLESNDYIYDMHDVSYNKNGCFVYIWTPYHTIPHIEELKEVLSNYKFFNEKKFDKITSEYKKDTIEFEITFR